MIMSCSKANHKMMMEIEFKVLFGCSGHLSIVISIRRFISQVNLYRNTGEHENLCELAQRRTTSTAREHK